MTDSDMSGSNSPLSAWDEYPIHQVVESVRYVGTSDPRAFERYWFTAEARDGSLLLIAGIGLYPNLGVIDAYALLVREGRQTTVRAHRRLGADRADLAVGPLRFGVARPFAEWRLSLADNDQSFSFDLRWFDTKVPKFWKFGASIVPHAPENFHLLHDWGGYESFGEVEGEIRIGETSIALTRSRYAGSRDHHWGIRDGVGGIVLNPRKNGVAHCSQFVEFKTWSIWGGQVLYNVGDPQTGPRRVTPVDHKFAFDPVTKHFREGVITNQIEGGETRTLHWKLVDNMTAFLRCAGYAGPDGRGAPDGNYLHGAGVGPSQVGDVRDIADPAVRMDLAGFEDNLCLVTCDGETTVGIFECMNPALYEMCASGRPGYAFLEPGSQA